MLTIYLATEEIYYVENIVVWQMQYATSTFFSINIDTSRIDHICYKTYIYSYIYVKIIDIIAYRYVTEPISYSRQNFAEIGVFSAKCPQTKCFLKVLSKEMSLKRKNNLVLYKIHRFVLLSFSSLYRNRTIPGIVTEYK